MQVVDLKPCDCSYLEQHPKILHDSYVGIVRFNVLTEMELAHAWANVQTHLIQTGDVVIDNIEIRHM